MFIPANKCSEIGIPQNPGKGPKGGIPACGVTSGAGSMITVNGLNAGPSLGRLTDRQKNSPGHRGCKGYETLPFIEEAGQ